MNSFLAGGLARNDKDDMIPHRLTQFGIDLLLNAMSRCSTQGHANRHVSADQREPTGSVRWLEIEVLVANIQTTGQGQALLPKRLLPGGVKVSNQITHVSKIQSCLQAHQSEQNRN